MAQINDASTLPFPELFKNLDQPLLKFMVLSGPTNSTRRNCIGYYQLWPFRRRSVVCWVCGIRLLIAGIRRKS
jgi:hypothetical protein